MPIEVELRRPAPWLIIRSFLEPSNLVQLEVNVVLSRLQFTRILVVFVARVDRLLLCLEPHPILAAAGLLLAEQGKHGVVEFFDLVHDLVLALGRAKAGSFVFLIKDHAIDGVRNFVSLE